jgi:hypothetical protein|tara:strand:- start:297 stop:674 length:378 start_codon:yes stop_codon:yes gene_type:complete
MNNLGGVRDIKKKLRGSDVIFQNRDKLAEALLSISQAKVTDVVDWDDQGKVSIKNLDEIPEHALQSIKKIKARPVGESFEVEIEMIDKVRVLQMLAKSAGILDKEHESEKPSVIEVNMVGPNDKT